MFKVLAILSFVGLAYGACPVFDTVPGLNLANQVGTWQIHGVLRPREKVGNLKCLNVGLTGSNFGVQPVLLKAHVTGSNADTGESIEIHATANVTNLQRPGRWNVGYGDDGLVHTGSVIYSDYVEYSLIALCNSATGVDLLDVFFLSRLHDPIPESTLNNFLNKLRDEYGIERTNYVSVYHDHHCGH